MRSLSGRIPAFVAILVVVGAACGSGSQPKTEAPEAFTSTEGRFSAEFPAKPKEETQTASAEGIQLVVHLFTAESDDYAISVGYVDYPEEFKTLDPQVVLSGVAEGAAGNIGGGEVTKNDPSTYMGLEAVDYEVSADDASLQAKAFLKENRMYILQGVSAELADAAGEYNHLVQSFQLL
jgi:hypothetical protein